MKNKKKLGLVGLALITALSSCASIQPHGHIDLAYVPSRIDDRVVENQFKAELDSNLELEIYGFHNCSHPILDSPEEQNILWNGETYRLNHDSRTEIGVKYKW